MLARKLGMISVDYETMVTDIIQSAGLPVKMSGVDTEKVYKQMYLDKKARRGRLNFILPTAERRVVKRELADRELILDVLRELLGN